MRSEWDNVLLQDVVSFNPRESMKKGATAKKVTMADVTEHQRQIRTYELDEYKSGSRFRNGDTLFARITPCLENGKIAQVDLLEKDEVGYGSTEFIVWRAKKGISMADFIYYLSKYPPIVDAAIKSMVGSSGRQRVQLDVLKNLEYMCPPLSNQKVIASTLSCLDAKIENNNKIIANLEQQAQAIFKSWFVDFEPFQDGEFVESELGLIPKGWETGVLGELIDVTSGKRPKSKSNDLVEEFCIPIIGASKIMGYTSEPLFGDKVLVIGRVGTHGIVQRIDSVCWPSDNTLVITSDFYEFVYQVLNSIDYTSLNRGSTQPLITQSDIKTHKIIIPPKDILVEFEDFISQLMNFQAKSKLQNGTLANLRDTLLPKLMSGEIEVSVDQSSS